MFKLKQIAVAYLKYLFKKDISYEFIPWNEQVRINNLARKEQGESLLFGMPVYFPDGYWYLYSVKELFFEKVYWFNSEKPNPIIIDCGANIGLSVIYFKRLFPETKIIAFEPDIKIFKMMEKNLQPYNFKDVELINKAVWISDEELTFFAEGTLGGKINLDTSNKEKDIIKIKSVQLKKLLNGKIDFLKIDIEGAEYEVLLDCKAELKNVGLLFFEYHGSKNKKEQTLHEILKVVTEAGFQYYIKESFPVVQFPFIEKASEKYYDLMLNVFCYRV